MFRGTTPTYTFTLKDTVDLTGATNVYVTFSDSNENEILTKERSALTVGTNTVSVFLTQAETLAFPNGRVLVQLNWTYEQGGLTKRACTNKKTITANRNLIDREI